MLKEYTPEQLEQIFQKLPEELKEAIFSLETAKAIAAASEKHGIVDNRLGSIGKYTGEVLMGLIAPVELQEALEKRVGLKTPVAQDILKDINRFVFFPVKAALEQLHEIPAQKPLSKPSKPTVDKKEVVSEKPKRISSDKYRESIE